LLNRAVYQISVIRGDVTAGSLSCLTMENHLKPFVCLEASCGQVRFQ